MTAKKPTKNIDELLNDEAEAIDADRDAPITTSKVTRGNGRSKTLQIRLNPEELDELERIAASRGLPTSTVARDAILHIIRPGLARSQATQRLVDGFADYLDQVQIAGDPPPSPVSGPLAFTGQAADSMQRIAHEWQQGARKLVLEIDTRIAALHALGDFDEHQHAGKPQH